MLIDEKDKAQRYFDIVGGIVASIDPSQKVNLINKAGCSILGYDEKDIVGRNWFDQFIPERIREDSRRVFHGLLSGDTKIEERYENPVLTKNGEERIISWHHVLLRDGRGQAVGVISSGEDITEYKKVENDLREAFQDISDLFESIPDIAYMVDKELKVVKWNRALVEKSGYSPEEIKGKFALDFFPEEDRQTAVDGIKEVYDKSVAAIEARLFTKDGRKIPYFLSGAVLKDKNGWVRGFVGVAKDITQRKELEKQLQFIQLGKLVADIAHEVNNPLMIISGRAQLTLMEDIINEEVKKNIRIIMAQCQRAKELIQRVLYFAKPSKGVLKKADINKTLEAVVNIVERPFGLVEVKIKRNYEKDLPFFAVDEQQMQEVFMNLLMNAKDSMPDGGAIEVCTSCGDNSLKIIFKDTGCGMSEEVLGKLFEPFFSTKEMGTGLGLSICHGIVKSHNGTLKFESKIGEGTTATILFPLNEAKAHA